jgi:endonuclease G
MEFFDIAAAAGRRWKERAHVREETLAKIRAGKALETESDERIQKRIDRLAENNKKANAAVERALVLPTAHKLVQAIGMERVIGRSDFLDINFIELALAVARFVGRINIRTAQGRSIGYGTGFMVSPRLLLTNNHVLESAAVAQHSLVEFDYQNDRAGRPLPIAGFRLEPATFFMTNKNLDFSLVAVSDVSLDGTTLQRYGWNRLIADQGKALKGEPLNIIQHPRGDAKQIVLRSNELVDLFEHYAHYVTDTEPGSSGSPVFNDQWEVVALHHSAVPKTDDQGNYIANDGTIWTPGRDPDDLAWVANEGIRVSSLVEYITRQPLTGLQAQLRHDLLNLEPPSPLEAAAASQADAAEGSAGGASAVAGQPSVGTNGATWTIPLTVTVQLGASQQAGAQPAALAPVAQAASMAAGGQTAGVVRATPAQPESGALAEALAEAEHAVDRPYYDAQTDEQARDAYYAGIDRGAGNLFEQLSQLLQSSHTTPLSYKPAKLLVSVGGLATAAGWRTGRQAYRQHLLGRTLQRPGTDSQRLRDRPGAGSVAGVAAPARAGRAGSGPG